MKLFNIAFTTKSAKTEIEKFMFRNIDLYKDDIDKFISYTDYTDNGIRTLFNYYLNTDMKKCLVINASYVNEIAKAQHRKVEQIVAMIIKYIKDNRNEVCGSNFFLSYNNSEKRDCWTFIKNVLAK